jgi:hypothetical protein
MHAYDENLDGIHWARYFVFMYEDTAPSFALIFFFFFFSCGRFVFLFVCFCSMAMAMAMAMAILSVVSPFRPGPCSDGGDEQQDLGPSSFSLFSLQSRSISLWFSIAMGTNCESKTLFSASGKP